MLILRHLSLPEVCHYTGLERLKIHDGCLVHENRNVPFHILAVNPDSLAVFMSSGLRLVYIIIFYFISIVFVWLCFSSCCFLVVSVFVCLYVYL